MSIDESIDRLREALSALGHHVPEGPDDATTWEKLDHELAPLALPADFRRLLQRVDVARLPLSTYPGPATLDFSLWSWREFRDGELPFPAGLFPWCYESHNHLFVELDGPGVEGGAMFEWGFAGSDFRLRFLGAQAWVETALAVLEEQAFDRVDRPQGPLLLVNAERWWELADERLDASEPHAVYGRQRDFGEAEPSWPRHWAAVARLVREDPPAEFPPMTIADVRARRRKTTVRALVTCRATYLAGTAGKAKRVWLQDDTGALDVLCPVDIRGHAALGSGGTFEVELVAEHIEAPAPAVDWPALATSATYGIPSYPDLLAHQPPDATATVVHRPRR